MLLISCATGGTKVDCVDHQDKGARFTSTKLYTVLGVQTRYRGACGDQDDKIKQSSVLVQA